MDRGKRVSPFRLAGAINSRSRGVSEMFLIKAILRLVIRAAQRERAKVGQAFLLSLFLKEWTDRNVCPTFAPKHFAPSSLF